MRVFVDTSAFYALLDEADADHAAAAAWLRDTGADAATILSTHNYVIVETLALVHRRLGSQAVGVFLDAFAPAVSVVHIDEQLHRRAITGYRASSRRRSSFVDQVSFLVMRDLELDAALAFDGDFTDAGFRLVPAQP